MHPDRMPGTYIFCGMCGSGCVIDFMKCDFYYCYFPLPYGNVGDLFLILQVTVLSGVQVLLPSWSVHRGQQLQSFMAIEFLDCFFCN